MQKNVKLYMIVLLLLLLFSGCNEKREVVTAVPAGTYEDVCRISGDMDVDVYLDSTPSMEGFVKPGPATYYAQVLQYLEDSALACWPNSNISLYRFGNEIVKIEDRSEFMEMLTPKAYTDLKRFKDTHIEKVLEEANTGNLTVIVTDLFENESDANNLVKKLIDKYLQSSLTVAIAGVKSDFDGNIYDIGIDKKSFAYASNGDPARYRPFYLIILGKYGDVSGYFENLKASKLKDVQDIEFIAISPEVVEEPASFKDAAVTYRQLAQVNWLLSEQVRSDRYRQFRVKDNVDKATLSARIYFNKLSYVPDLNSDKIEAEIKAYKLVDKKMAEDDSLADRLKLGRITTNADGLSIDMEISAAKLPLKQICCFQITMTPRADSYTIPSWVDGWDLDVNLITTWVNAPESFNGSSTINLSRIVKGLWSANYKLHQPKIADFSFYIIKE